MFQYSKIFRIEAQLLSQACCFLWLCGCAGPATPLGAIWTLNPVSESQGGADHADATDRAPAAYSGRSPKLHFDPPRQVLHGPRAMTVIVDDPQVDPTQYNLSVRYNGHNVTRAFLQQASVTHAENSRKMLIRIPVVRLEPSTDHSIEIGYTNKKTGESIKARYGAPVCRAFEIRPVSSLDEFNPPKSMVQSIDRISRESGFSPTFSTALIAQESSFNPRTVSSAKAIGLTQMTSVAESELSDDFAHWPRFPGIGDMPFPLVKVLVASGRVNERNEWRLDPDRSIRGGLSYAQFLAQRWSSPENMKKISAISSDLEVEQTKLVLASYNSGYSRVSAALRQYGKKWLTAPELREARKYVNRIFSYCDAFSDNGVPYENQT